MNLAKSAIMLAFIAALTLPLAAMAQYNQDFESLNGSAAGVILTGQGGYYLPNGTGDTDFKVYTYAGNALGIVQNPDGGNQFIAGTGPGDGGVTYARAQVDVAFGDGTGVWTIWYDFCGLYSGAPPGSNNLGSFSVRQGGNTVHINLFTWVDPNNPVAINSTYIPYHADGSQFPIPGTPPGPAWSNLPPNHWFRCRTVVDLNQNLIVEVGIRDLSGGQETVYDPTGWYLVGGAAGMGSPPTGIRWFAGGTTPGNSTAWDNAILVQNAAEGACCMPDGSCMMTTHDQCQGQYQGDGTTCNPNPCHPTPVKAVSWGAIKSRYR